METSRRHSRLYILPDTTSSNTSLVIILDNISRAIFLDVMRKVAGCLVPVTLLVCFIYFTTMDVSALNGFQERGRSTKICPMHKVCTNVSNLEETCCSSECSCDERCMHTKSCCIDTNRNYNMPTFRTACTNAFENTIYYQGLRSNIEKHEYYYEMVVDCANGTMCPTLETSPDGMDFADIVTVFSVEENVLFKNSRCAECNGVYEYERWSLMAIGCAHEENENKGIGMNARIDRILNSCCLFSYPPSQDLQKYRCYVGTVKINACNVTGLWRGVDQYLEEACLDPYANVPVFYAVYHHHYRNIFCLLCNSPDGTDINQLLCESAYRGSEGPFKSFDTILNISLDSVAISKSDNFREEYSCEEHEIFDTVHRTCRQLYCMERTVPSYGKCVKQPATKIGQTPSYSVDVGLKPVNLNYPLTKDVIDILTINEQRAIYQQGIFGQIVAVINAPECKISLYNNYIMFYVSPEDIVEYGVISVLFKESQSCNYSHFIHTISCLHVKKQILLFILNNQTFEYIIELSFLRQTYILSTYQTPIELSILNTSNMPDNSENTFGAILNTTVPLYCPYISMNKSEYCEIVGSKCDADGGEPFPKTLACPILFDAIFDTINQTYLVCLETYEKLVQLPLPINTAPSLKGIFSLSVSCASMCSIIVSLYLFLKLNKIINAPVCVYTCAMINLFLAQAVFQFGSGWTEFSQVCKTMGMALHYFWLTAVFAMNAYCVIMVKYVDSVGHPFRHIVSGALLYIYGLPVGFVLCNVVYSNIHNRGPKLVSGYGADLCHIDSREMRLVLFALPILLTVLCNCIVYTWTVCKIMSITVAVAPYRKPNAYVVVYVRLLLVTGISWCIGFVNEFVQIETLDYMFVLFVAGQGIFLLMSSCFSNPVRDQLFTCSTDTFTCVNSWVLSKISSNVDSDNRKQ